MSTGLEEWMDCPSTGRDDKIPVHHSRTETHTHSKSDVDDWLKHDPDSVTKAQIFAHPDISPNLIRWFTANPELKRSYLKAIEGIKKKFGDMEINAYIDRDYDEPNEERPVLEVQTEIDSVDEWMEIKFSVRKIVRNAEHKDTMIYTRIERI